MSARDAELRRFLEGRDPRVDPLAGDVVEQLAQPLIRRRGAARRVLSTDLALVCVQATPRPMGTVSHWCSLKAWRRWAKGGRVVCRGGGGA